MNTTLGTALQIILIIVSTALVASIILQAKGSGLGNLFGGGDSTFGLTKTRRGLEKTLFQITIMLSAAFLITSLLLLMVQS
ncbi:MAG: preprotein translocase subunit SecG [Anaerolineae bacterium]|nr:preprotein translocase subunit SecG [Anaerolineae bacterium]